jgi:polyphosphate kinase
LLAALQEKAELRDWFVEKVEPLLTPLAVDPGHPFPAIGSLTLSVAVELMDEYEDTLGGGFEKHTHFAIVTVPSGLARWKRLSARGPNAFIPVEQVIIANLDRLFGGMLVLSANMFRPTRNADVVRNEEEAEDLLEMMSDEVRERRFAPFVRLEVEASMPAELVMRVVEEMALTPQDVFTVSAGPVGLGELDSLPVQFGMDNSLLYSHWAPATHTRLMNVKKKAASGDGRSESIFAAIRRGDILVHHPYHSFATSTQLFVESAARDPAVVAIKATLYRTSSDSPIINALAVAAENGKQVAVLVELKARFDEARNVGFANKLEDAGCNVAYGLVGLKTHCKAMLVVRQEEDGLRTYVHLGTGNYNPRTASLYTDVGLLSCDPELGADVSDLFKYLTGYHRQTAYRKLLVAPNAMRRQFCELIDNEIAHANAGRPAGITAKMNGLDDRVLVEKLYQAAAAGVRIDLVVRGICRMRPGVPGLSESVRVVSIIGRFLEHHRIFRFQNGGEPRFFIGSADWMSRNLMRRVEVCTPITNDVLKSQLQALLDACLSDGVNAWELQPDGRYHKPCRSCLTHEAYGDDRLAARAKEVGLHSALIEARCRGVPSRARVGASALTAAANLRTLRCVAMRCDACARGLGDGCGGGNGTCARAHGFAACGAPARAPVRQCKHARMCIPLTLPASLHFFPFARAEHEARAEGVGEAGPRGRPGAAGAQKGAAQPGHCAALRLLHAVRLAAGCCRIVPRGFGRGREEREGLAVVGGERCARDRRRSAAHLRAAKKDTHGRGDKIRAQDTGCAAHKRTTAPQHAPQWRRWRVHCAVSSWVGPKSPAPLHPSHRIQAACKSAAAAAPRTRAVRDERRCRRRQRARLWTPP